MSTMFSVVAPNDWDNEHLSSVIEEMKKLGPPTIRLVKFDENSFGAVEGSHRLEAARRLCYIPAFKIMTESFMTSQAFGAPDSHQPTPSSEGKDVVVTPDEFVKNVSDILGWIGNYYHYSFEFLIS